MTARLAGVVSAVAFVMPSFAADRAAMVVRVAVEVACRATIRAGMFSAVASEMPFLTASRSAMIQSVFRAV